jgi:DNA-binding response OmpR family regulator
MPIPHTTDPSFTRHGQTSTSLATAHHLHESRQGIRILFIDDEIRPGDPLVCLLTLDGFSVTCETTAAAGMAATVTASPDAIILDLHLPDMLGITVLSELRHKACKIPVIVVTGWYTDSGHEQVTQSLGAAAFLRKPLDSGELGAAVRRATVMHAPRPNLVQPAPTYCSKRTFRRDLPPQFIANDASLRQLHAKAIGGDQSAVDVIVESVEPFLRRSLIAQFARVDRDWIHDAVQDTVLEYRSCPARFDVALGVPLKSFFLLAARRDLLNRIRAERRRREIVAECNIAFAADIEPTTERRLDLQRALRRIRNGMSNVELRIFQNVLEGNSRIEHLARAAQIDHLSLTEQRTAINRIIKRLFQRMRRLGLRK